MQPDAWAPTLAQAPGSLTALTLGDRMLKKRPDSSSTADVQTSSMANVVLQGLSTLRYLDVQVRALVPVPILRPAACSVF